MTDEQFTVIVDLLKKITTNTEAAVTKLDSINDYMGMLYNQGDEVSTFIGITKVEEIVEALNGIKETLEDN